MAMNIWPPNTVSTILNGIWRHDTKMFTYSSNLNLRASQIMASKRQICLTPGNIELSGINIDVTKVFIIIIYSPHSPPPQIFIMDIPGMVFSCSGVGYIK